MKPVFAALLAGVVAYAFGQAVSAADAGTYKEKVLYSFTGNVDGAQPYANVINVKGALYGTTFAGGDQFGGAVFSLDPSTGTERVLYSFGSQDGYPEAGLIDAKGMLYGTVSGADGLGGFVFSLDLSTGAEKTVYGFCSQANCADGFAPVAGLIRVKDTLYGTTLGGGNAGCNGYGCGTVFSVDRNTGAEKVLYSFCRQKDCADGLWPAAGLVAVDGMLYGTAVNGGVGGCHQNLGCGTAFSIDLNTGTEKTLYTFCSRRDCKDGANSFASLTALNGVLYGTTLCGGEYGADTECFGRGYGTVFSIDPNTGAEKVLHSFGKGKDGRKPLAGLIAASGVLYGTTMQGGRSGCGGDGCGMVFSLDPSTGVETVLHYFDGSDGDSPSGNLTAVNGRFYGTTIYGGAANNGTVFVLRAKR
jgi:uncharacterized repeat protein (TIGR03803 family)